MRAVKVPAHKFIITMKLSTFSWVAQVIVVFIMGQTLFFKFTDAPETVELFAKLGQGALAYKAIGSLELIACVLLLVRSTIALGAIMACLAEWLLSHVPLVFSWADSSG